METGVGGGGEGGGGGGGEEVAQEPLLVGKIHITTAMVPPVSLTIRMFAVKVCN